MRIKFERDSLQKAKPRKQGGFWDRLQEAQKKQMEEMEKKNKKGEEKVIPLPLLVFDVKYAQEFLPSWAQD